MARPDPLTRTLLALTFVTGIVDAVAFLGLGQVFAAMQTGNVIFLGFGIAGTTHASIAAPLVGLAAFVAGALAAALLVHTGMPERGLGLRAAMVAEVVLLGVAAAIAAAAEVVPDEGAAYALIALLSFAMGLRGSMARGLGGANLATTVLNLTVTGVGAHAPIALASGRDLSQRSVAVAAILAGATVGALLLKTSVALPIAVAAAVTLATAVVSFRARLPPEPAAAR
jgi:uncharacterized membrane protein YoaK (UPF0700 family)